MDARDPKETYEERHKREVLKTLLDTSYYKILCIRDNIKDTGFAHEDYDVLNQDSFWEKKYVKGYPSEDIKALRALKTPFEKIYSDRISMLSNPKGKRLRFSDVNFQHMYACMKMMENSCDSAPKLHFSGEFDSNQSTFESESNQLKLGVLCKDHQVATAILRLIRFQVDSYSEEDIKFQFRELFKNANNRKKMTYYELIALLSEGESDYGDSYDLPGPFVVRYVGGTTLTRNIYEVDIWTLERAFKDLEV